MRALGLVENLPSSYYRIDCIINNNPNSGSIPHTTTSILNITCYRVDSHHKMDYDRSKSNSSSHQMITGPYDNDMDNKQRTESRRSSSYVSSHFSYALVGSQQYEQQLGSQIKIYKQEPTPQERHVSKKEFDDSGSAQSLPSDISVDLQQHVGGRDRSDASDYDEDKERKQLVAQQVAKPRVGAAAAASGLTSEQLNNFGGSYIGNPMEKVQTFLINNPLCQTFIKKEKGRLPYSVFKPHSERVCFIKSIYDKRPPTAFFPYPRYTKKSRDCDRIRQYSGEEVEYLFMAFRINDSTHIYNAVVNAFKNAGFQMIEKGNTWNVQWTGYTKHEDIRGNGNV